MPYVVLEGTEGAGKSLLLSGLKKRFSHLHPISLREPGGTPMTAALREYLLNHLADITPLEQLMMFTTDRVVLNIAALRASLRRKHLVFGDRSFLDTLVIQCIVQQAIDTDWYLDLLRRLDFPMPDLVLDLRLDPAVGLTRRNQAGDLNDLDRKPLEFHQAQRAAMDTLPALLPQVKFHIIDATQSPEAMLEDAVSAVQQLLSAA